MKVRITNRDRWSRMLVTTWPLVLLTAIGCGHSVADEQRKSAGEKPAPGADRAIEHETLLLSGQVVWAADALERQFGISTVPEAKERLLALETTDGQLHPIVEDARGRAFRNDSRLRDRDVELLIRRHPAARLVQIVRVYVIKPDGKYLVDYWCEICSISMIEDGPCDCCQEPNQLRLRPVE